MSVRSQGFPCGADISSPNTVISLAIEVVGQFVPEHLGIWLYVAIRPYTLVSGIHPYFWHAKEASDSRFRPSAP